jgi:hypothetical protein
MKIMLPNNNFGLLTMLVLIALTGIVPFVVALWLSMKVAPLWVAFPIAISTSLITLLLVVKRRD